MQSELAGVTKVYSITPHAFVAVIALDQKSDTKYPAGCFVWSPSVKSDAIPELLVYTNPTAGSGQCRSGATCICARQPCRSLFRSKRSLRIESSGSYDVHVKDNNGKLCVYQLKQITCNKDNYKEVNGMLNRRCSIASSGD